jgi:hypothetical protein
MPSLRPLPTPRWYSVPARVLFFTFLLTLLSFAVSLLLSILALVVSAQMRGIAPDLRFAYRQVAPAVGAVAGAVTFVVSLVMEIRHYRQTKTLAGIARASQQ